MIIIMWWFYWVFVNEIPNKVYPFFPRQFSSHWYHGGSRDDSYFVTCLTRFSQTTEPLVSNIWREAKKINHRKINLIKNYKSSNNLALFTNKAQLAHKLLRSSTQFKEISPPSYHGSTVQLTIMGVMSYEMYQPPHTA